MKNKYRSAILIGLFVIIVIAMAMFFGGNEKKLSEKVKCVEAGGSWTSFSSACVDSCYHERNKPVPCLAVLTPGCDCGQDKCWNGGSCELNYIAEFSDCIKIENLELGLVNSSGLIIVFNENVTSVQVESFIKEHFSMYKIRNYDYKLSKPKLIAVEMEKEDQLYWICKLEIENYTILDFIDFNLELRLQ